MKIYNEEKTQILTEKDIDYSLGRLIEDKLIIHHPEKIEVKEKGHFITLREYPNGGKDVEWIVDEPGQEAQKAYDEEEEIYIFKRYSPLEQQHKEKQRIIMNNKAYLENTDYVVTKITEHRLLGIDTTSDLEQYADIIQKREQARADINAAEQFLKENPINKEEI